MMSFRIAFKVTLAWVGILWTLSVAAALHEVDFLGVVIPKQFQLKQSQETVNLQGYSANLVNGEPFYVGALFTSIPQKIPAMLLLSDTPMAMVCYIVQDEVTPDLWVKTFTEDLLVNNPGWENEAINKSRLTELQTLFQKTYNAGDVVAFEYSANRELVVSINGTVLKTWENSRTLFNALLRTWVGPYPPTRDFKEAILGNQ